MQNSFLVYFLQALHSWDGRGVYIHVKLKPNGDAGRLKSPAVEKIQMFPAKHFNPKDVLVKVYSTQQKNALFSSKLEY